VPPHVAYVDELVGSALTPGEQAQLAGLLRKVRDTVNPEAAIVTPEASRPEPAPG